MFRVCLFVMDFWPRYGYSNPIHFRSLSLWLSRHAFFAQFLFLFVAHLMKIPTGVRRSAILMHWIRRRCTLHFAYLFANMILLVFPWLMKSQRASFVGSYLLKWRFGITASDVPFQNLYYFLQISGPWHHIRYTHACCERCAYLIFIRSYDWQPWLIKSQCLN